MKIDSGYKAIGFDMDGTLVDTKINYDELNMAEFDTLTSLGVPVKKINVTESTDVAIRQSIEYLRTIGKEYSFDQIEKLINKRAEDIEMRSVFTANCFSGTIELLKRIKSAGYLIGLLTRGQRKYVESVMKKCEIMGYMDAIDAFDDHPVGLQKPNPVAMNFLAQKLGVSVKEILYIGDNVWDYYCARDAGAGFIGVASGRHGRTKWDALDEDVFVVDSVTALIDLFEL
ncbi:MAG: HAD family hydrolase [archaeon]|nr:HAD family hydrolase [archaeon]